MHALSFPARKTECKDLATQDSGCVLKTRNNWEGFGTSRAALGIHFGRKIIKVIGDMYVLHPAKA
jgi:hypothetical protein